MPTTDDDFFYQEKTENTTSNPLNLEVQEVDSEEEKLSEHEELRKGVDFLKIDTAVENLDFKTALSPQKILKSSTLDFKNDYVRKNSHASDTKHSDSN